MTNRQQRRAAARSQVKSTRRNIPTNRPIRTRLEAEPKFAEAVERLDAGDFRPAGQALDSLLTAHRDNPALLHLRAVCASYSGDCATALSMIRKAIALDGQNARYHEQLGRILIELPDASSAIDSFRRAVALDPNFADAHAHLGAALDMTGDTEEAKRAYERALELDPRNYPARIGLAIQLQLDGRFEDAEQLFAQALAVRPEASAPIMLSVHGRRIAPGDPAVGRIETLLTQGGRGVREMWKLHFTLAKCMDDTGDYARAFHHYQIGNMLRARGGSSLRAPSRRRQTRR